VTLGTHTCLTCLLLVGDLAPYFEDAPEPAESDEAAFQPGENDAGAFCPTKSSILFVQELAESVAKSSKQDMSAGLGGGDTLEIEFLSLISQASTKTELIIQAD
jgi:hypothetical protein